MVGERVFREVDERTWEVRRRLDDCDRDGIDVQVLSTVPVMFSYGAPVSEALALARLLNDHIAEVVAQHPRRFIGLGTLPLQSPDEAVRELERCVRDLGFAGVQIGTHVNGWNLDRPEVFTVLAAAQNLGAAVFVHPWDMMAPERMTRYMLGWLVGMPVETTVAICSLLLGGVLERLPSLKVGFAHGGGAFAGTLGRIEHGYKARPDLVARDNHHPPRAYLKRLYMDTLVHDPAVLRILLDLVGMERLALGSDYPFPLGEEKPGSLIDSMPEFDATAKARLRSGTALEFLGREAAAYQR
jgi:aminocarboxymuconate-semialdehyde decarboxylase